MVTHDDIFQSLINMINWSFQVQDKYKFTRYKGHMEKYISKELCTIKFCLPRQSGHSTFAKYLLKSKEIFKESIYIVPLIRYISVNMNMIDNSRIISLEELKEKKVEEISKNPDAVIIDLSSFISQEDIEYIYDKFDHYAKTLNHFIFLFLA